MFRLLAALVAAFVLYNLWIFGHILYWRQHDPQASAFMKQQQARLQLRDPDAGQSHEHFPHQSFPHG